MKHPLLMLGLVAVLAPLRIVASEATFVASTSNPDSTISTATDFNTVDVALTDPGTPLRGTVKLAATASSDRGLESVRFQNAPTGSDAWTDLCTDTATPFTCAFDTTTVADGLHDVRALALDKVGYSRAAVVARRQIDNTAPSTTLADPGTPLSGTTTLTATATDAGSGVASVALQYRSAGGEWTTICAETSCSLDTRTLPDGRYDLRSRVTDAAGNTATSVIADRSVDNTGPRGAAIEAVNGRGTAGRIDTGDVVTFTYTEELDPASVLDDWDGARTDVSVRIGDVGRIDTLIVRQGARHVAVTALLAPLLLAGDYTSTGAEFAATMQQVGEKVVVTLGRLTSGSTRTTLLTARLLWTPASSVTDLAGNAGSNAPVTGSAGRDF